MAWSIIATDLDAAQQTASIVLQLSGEARNMARHLSYNDLTNGALINGNHVGPVAYLLHHLAINFSPLGEEAQLAAIAELHRFDRKPGESIDGLLSRFLTPRYRASQEGQGMPMSWQGYAWILLGACGANDNQFLQLLMPFQGRLLATEQEFGALQLSLRRMGHIAERSRMNIARQLRTQPSRGVFYQGDGQTNANVQNEPWQQGQDPWSGATSSGAWVAAPTPSTDPWNRPLAMASRRLLH